MLIEVIILTWLMKKGWDAAKGEYDHSRDRHSAEIARTHADWSPRRVRRHASRRAWGEFWTEVRDGFPQRKAAWAEDRLTARVKREELLAAGELRMRELWGRLDAAKAQREAAKKKAGTAEDEPVPVPGTAEPVPGTEDAGTREDGTGPVPEIPPVPEAAVPESGEDPGTGTAPAAEEIPVPAPVPPVPADDDPRLCEGQRIRDASGKAHLCAACGNPAADTDPLVVATDGFRVHRSHVTDPTNGYYDKEAPPAAGGRDPLAHCADCPHPSHWPAGCPECNCGIATGIDDAVDPCPPAADKAEPAHSTPPPTANGNGEAPVTTPSAANDTTTAADVENADTPYEGMQNALDNYGRNAAAIAQQAQDDLTAAAATHGFDRDKDLMAKIQAIQDAAESLTAATGAAKSTLTGNHAEGAEYHTGQDAHASGFRPA